MKIDCGYFLLDMIRLWDRVSKSTFDVKKRETYLARLLKKTQGGQVGFLDYPIQFPPDDLQRVVAEAHRIQRDFEGVMFFGIGGSYLGARTLVEALSESEFPIHWVSNIDSHEIEKAEKFAKKYRSAAVVVSKSGNTTETLSAFFHFSQKLDPKGFVFVTDPKSGELRRLSKALNVTTFDVPSNIGGRFSVLTHVGLLPAAIAGVDPKRVLHGAVQMRRILERSPSENPGCLFAEALFLADTKLRFSQHYLMPYQMSLKPFAEWFVQLWGESLGKMVNDSVRVGPTPIAALGSSDQHSILQLLKEGPLNKVVGFLDVIRFRQDIKISRPSFAAPDFEHLFRHTFDEVSHLACLATKESLERATIPTYRFEIQRLTPEVLGALFIFFEFACAYSAELYDIDAFGQPGVEESKQLLRKSL